MTIEFWKAVTIVGAAILTVVSVWRKVLRPMWKRARHNYKTGATLIEELRGDPANGKPSLMELVTQVRAEQARQAAEIAELKAVQSEHQEWHANPGGRPAKAVPPRPNGPSPGRR
jgi:hypothetical protein